MAAFHLPSFLPSAPIPPHLSRTKQPYPQQARSSFTSLAASEREGRPSTFFHACSRSYGVHSRSNVCDETTQGHARASCMQDMRPRRTMDPPSAPHLKRVAVWNNSRNETCHVLRTLHLFYLLASMMIYHPGFREDADFGITLSVRSLVPSSRLTSPWKSPASLFLRAWLLAHCGISQCFSASILREPPLSWSKAAFISLRARAIPVKCLDRTCN